jgi:hypothetical protein
VTAIVAIAGVVIGASYYYEEIYLPQRAEEKEKLAHLRLGESPGHILVVAGSGEHTVKLYRDEATFEKIKELKKQGGPMAMLGGLGEGLVTRELDNHTPGRIISQDSEGAHIEVTDGPDKGAQGFVAMENLEFELFWRGTR